MHAHHPCPFTVQSSKALLLVAWLGWREFVYSVMEIIKEIMFIWCLPRPLAYFKRKNCKLFVFWLHYIIEFTPFLTSNFLGNLSLSCLPQYFTFEYIILFECNIKLISFIDVCIHILRECLLTGPGLGDHENRKVVVWVFIICLWIVKWLTFSLGNQVHILSPVSDHNFFS